MRIYLSSTFLAREDGREALLELRQDLKRRGGRRGVEVCLGEDDESVHAASSRGDLPGVLEGCARLMSRCDAFFCLLFERHGTRLTMPHDAVAVTAAVSIFEAELLQASMTGKKVLVVRSTEMSPGPALADFLRLVDGSLGPSIIEADRRSLTSVFDDFCRALLRSQVREAPWIFDAVSLSRVRRSGVGELLSPGLSFLGGRLRTDGGGVADGAVVSAALERVEAGRASDSRALGQLEMLSYLWVAIREFARASAHDRMTLHRDSLRRTLELWNASAAWYGIHGSHPMGCLASLNDVAYIVSTTGFGRQPLGPRSSAYYSIGARMRSKAAARRLFGISLTISQAALRGRPDDPSGILQMTASAKARLAMLDRPWRYLGALRDFRRSLQWRERNAASDAAVGEAKNAYAHALFRLPWRRAEALRLAEEASSLFRTSVSDTSAVLFIRAEHKRATMLWQASRREEAFHVATAARDAATNAQAFDQERQLQELIDVWRLEDR